MPVVIESTGAIGRSARAFFIHLLANTTRLPGEAPDMHMTKLLRIIAVTLATSTGNKFLTARAIHHGEEPPRPIRPSYHMPYYIRSSPHHYQSRV